MSFAKRIDAAQSPRLPLSFFVGREEQLTYCREHILLPDRPSHTLVYISGQCGMGKSTLLMKVAAEAATTKNILTTSVHVQQGDDAESVMKQIARQLKIEGKFEKGSIPFPQIGKLRNSQTPLYHFTQLFIAELNGLLKKQHAQKLLILLDMTELDEKELIQKLLILLDMAKLDKKELIQKLIMFLDTAKLDNEKELIQKLNLFLDMAKREKELIQKLTNFLDMTLGTAKLDSKKELIQKLINFLDTAIQLSHVQKKDRANLDSEKELASWLFSYAVSSAALNGPGHIVFVVSGRSTLARLLPLKDQPQLSYNLNIHQIVLEGFTKDETDTFLVRKKVADAEKRKRIWQWSRGFPLYLDFFTKHLSSASSKNENDYEHDISTLVAKHLLEDYLPLPQDEQLRYRFALDMALLCMGFQRDDVEMFSYVPKDECQSLYDWLLNQPFVLMDGSRDRYKYHEVVQYFFRKFQYMVSSDDYYATRRVLIQVYKEKLANIANDQDHNRSLRLKLTHSLAGQLFFMPDEVSHMQAVEYILYEHGLTDVEVTRCASFLDSLKKDALLSRDTCEIIKNLIHYINYSMLTVNNNQYHHEFLEATTYFLEHLHAIPSFVDSIPGLAQSLLRDLTSKIEKYPGAGTNNGKGSTQNLLKSSYYNLRSGLYFELKDYHQALTDIEQARLLVPNSEKFAQLYAQILEKMKE